MSRLSIASLALFAGFLAVRAADPPRPDPAPDLKLATAAESKAEFDKNPIAFIEKVAAYNEKDPKDPVNGKKANLKITSEYKATVGVCCNKCVAKFSGDPDKYIVKALKK